ncbi:hypothetical protein [Terribacillus saccharophilus]|uniref:hypothetical protein n=1 Tax=Terribacillus saccharophilus TaxID=361277 RepID=UPI0039827327
MGMRLEESDFFTFRDPLQERQSISSLGFILTFSIFLNAVLFLLTYVVVYDYSIFPNKEKIFRIHLYVTIILSFLSLIFGLPIVYKRFERIQYFLSIIVSQNIFGAFPLIIALFAIGRVQGIEQPNLLTITALALSGGGLVFVVTTIRLFILLNRGEYRADSRNDITRKKWEDIIRGKSTIIIALSVGASFIIQYLFRFIPLRDFDIILIGTLCIIIFMTMLFVLPEQLVILYCKFRFESFNHNRKGNLKPFGYKPQREKKKKQYSIKPKKLF